MGGVTAEMLKQRQDLQLDLVDIPKREPFNCPYELKVVDIGGGKSFCESWDCWTNCREVGHCVYLDVNS